MTARDLLEVALHASGHALARFTYRWPIVVVSPRPGAGHSGVTIGPTDDWHLSRMLDGRHPLDDLEPEARRWDDRQFVIALAGVAAETLIQRRIGNTPRPVKLAVTTVSPRNSCTMPPRRRGCRGSELPIGRCACPEAASWRGE